ncbi:MAG: hypothetical protein U5L10_05265 [Candidatus Moranbacteria bacterium]|nr:hypothetical protein [Candidatus Moranbacteria bacterium]MDZ7611144.1 hypothetical protein [Candidatus Moranbacteria bacterium]MDZ7611149.1 hypothetical protein [Candidatus Moranbacteria bacterium]MDZ7611423.1 hypothetical protein [Candidatus Moranbacteria bacterium]MDZ7611428.1 hypothetical protein [Candidatus Moranbacteria bacterium]
MSREGKSKIQISKELGIRKATIIEWLKQDKYQDKRGWKKDKARKYTDKRVGEKICQLREDRILEKSYFIGSEYLQMDYANNYPCEELPSDWFIKETIRRNNLQTRKPKKRKKGGAEYLLFPSRSIKSLGHIHQSGDFIGKKYISGRSEPVNILSTSYYFPFKLYEIARLPAEKAVYAIEKLYLQWQIYPIPDVFRMDNGLQFRGTASGKRSLGKFVIFLLNLGVTPLFGAPSKPWNNPHVEGHNRVFNEKVWKRNHFKDLNQIDNECDRFNAEGKELFRFKYSNFIINNYQLCNFLEKKHQIKINRLETVKNKKICFVRFAESFEEKGNAFFTIMNEQVAVPEKYTHQFVFAEWYLDKEELIIYSEYKKERTMIRKMKFEINC